MKKILVIGGATSSGKTALALHIAKLFKGEVVNADARQIYRDAPIGTGIPAGEWKGFEGKEVYHVQGIPHHLMAYASPEEKLGVAQWVEKAKQTIEKILVRGKLPIIVGGTGLFIRALTEGYVFSGEVDQELRIRLLELSPEERLEQLRTQGNISGIDTKNPHRVLRALEKVLTHQPLTPQKEVSEYTFLKLGRSWEKEALYERMKQAIQRQLETGWIEEVQALLDKHTPRQAPLLTSIGFPHLVHYLETASSDKQALEALIIRDTWQYIRRQRTWFRKEPNLQWVNSEEEAEALVRAWL